MQGHEVDSLLGLAADDADEELGVHLRDVAEERDGLVDWHGAERLRRGVEHALADRRDLVLGRRDREVHHEVRPGVERHLELLELVALAGVGHAAAEVGVDLGGEHPPHADRRAVASPDATAARTVAASSPSSLATRFIASVTMPLRAASSCVILFSPSTFQLFNLSTFQPFNFSTFQLFNYILLSQFLKTTSWPFALIAS